MAAEVSQKELAAAIKRTPRQVHNLTEKGVFTKTAGGKYPWPDSLHAFIDYQVDLRSADEDDTVAELERRDAAATASLKELRLARERADVVTKEAHRAELMRFAMIVRQVMDTFPGKLAPRLPGDSPLGERVAALRKISRQVLEDLRVAGMDVTAHDSSDAAPPAEDPGVACAEGT